MSNRDISYVWLVLPMIRAVCFDFDGTIINSNSVKNEVLLSILGDTLRGKEKLNELQYLNPPLDRYEVFEEFAREFRWTEDNLEERIRDFNFKLHNLMIKCSFMPGARKCLDKLSFHEIPLFINSATPETDLVKVVGDLSISNYFRGIWGRPSSKAENVERLLAQINLSPAEVLMIGDGKDDQEAAFEIGCNFQPVFSFRGDVTTKVSVLYDLLEIFQYWEFGGNIEY